MNVANGSIWMLGQNSRAARPSAALEESHPMATTPPRVARPPDELESYSRLLVVRRRRRSRVHSRRRQRPPPVGAGHHVANLTVGEVGMSLGGVCPDVSK